MRIPSCLFAALLVIFAAQPALRAEERTQPTSVEAAQAANSSAPQSQAVSCVDSAYQHYLSDGITPQNAWSDAVRDCQNGVDPACIQRAQQHYMDLGENPNTAWSNAVRDC